MRHHATMSRLRADRPRPAAISWPGWRPASAGSRWPTCWPATDAPRGGARARRPTRRPHHAAQARHVIHIFLGGGLSQVDSFDYKPELIERHGQPMPATERPDVFFGKVGRLHRPHWAFQRRGQSGLWISDLFPHLAEVADELTVIHSMVAETANHTPATSRRTPGFRHMGSRRWARGSPTAWGARRTTCRRSSSCPTRGACPAGGAINWTSGFLPAQHQGVAFHSRGPAIPDLARPPSDRRRAAGRDELLAAMTRHLAEHGDQRPAGRPDAELRAGRPDAVGHPRGDRPRRARSTETHALYGLDRPESADFGRACLLGAAAAGARGPVRPALVRRPFGGRPGTPTTTCPAKNHTGEAPADRPPGRRA